MHRVDAQKRLVEHTRTIYLADDLTRLGPGKLGRHGLKYEDYKLALTRTLLDEVFGPKVNDTIGGSTALEHLADSSTSGYLSGSQLATLFDGLDTTGQYWIRSGEIAYDAAHFFVPVSHTDAFGNATSVSYDYKQRGYFLFLESVKDASGNTTSVEEFDFRVLMPRQMKDVNENISEVRFDRLGMPAAMALLGGGDSLSGMSDAVINPSTTEIQSFFTGSYSGSAPSQWLGNATARYVYWFGQEVNPDKSVNWAKHPPAACGILREKHVAALNTGEESLLQVAIEYSDGLGTVLVKKAQAEPLPGRSTLRWIGSGKTALNNKGKPVKQYEPYFSTMEHRFDGMEAESDTQPDNR